MSRIFPGRIVEAFLLLVLAAGSAGAASLDYSDALGTWCGSRSNPNWTNMDISRDALAITHLPGGNQTVLRIDHFEFSDAHVLIYYLAAGLGNQANKPGSTLARVEFIRFSADGRSMVQATSDISAEYTFTRCR